MGQNFRSSIYFQETTKITKKNGICVPIKQKNDIFMLTYKFVARESSNIRSLFLEENMSNKKRKTECEMGPSLNKLYFKYASK